MLLICVLVLACVMVFSHVMVFIVLYGVGLSYVCVMASLSLLLFQLFHLSGTGLVMYWYCGLALGSCDVGSSLQCRCFLLLISPGVNLPANYYPRHHNRHQCHRHYHNHVKQHHAVCKKGSLFLGMGPYRNFFGNLLIFPGPYFQCLG